MGDFLLQLLEVSITAGLVGSVLVLLTPTLNKRFSIYWKRWAWLLLALRLVFPFSFALPQAPVSIQIPSVQSTRPSIPSNGAAPAPAAWNMGADTQPGVDWLQVAAVVWLIVAAVVLLRGLVAYAVFRRKAIRWSLPATENILNDYSSVLNRLGLATGPRLYISKQVNSPMLVGVFRPVILLPHTNYPHEELELIMCHELTHYKRKDTWVKLLMHIAKSLHWFNPAIYFMARQTERDIELACDERVLQVTGHSSRRAYGSLILAGATASSKYPAVLTTGFSPEKKLLTERITNIMMKNKKRGGLALLALAVAAVLLCGLLVAFSTEKPTNELPEAQSTYVQTEYATLLSLKPENYEDMTVAEFRAVVLDAIEQNEEEVHALYDREDEQLEAMRYTDADSSFILNTLIPLTSEYWHMREYGTWWQDADTVMELSLTREILDENTLTVRQHNEAIFGAFSAAEEWARSADANLLNDASALQAEMDKIAAMYSDSAVSVRLEAWYQTGFESLPAGNGLGDDEVIGLPTQADYEQVLALQFPGYQNMSVTEYVTLVQEAFNADNGEMNAAYERVMSDVLDGSYSVQLSEEEKEFLAVTLYSTVSYYVAEHQSQYSDNQILPAYSIVHYENGPQYEIQIVYDIEYAIAQPDTLLISERDQILSSLNGEIWEYISSQDNSFWMEGEAEFTQFVGDACVKHSVRAMNFASNLFIYQCQ